MCMRGFAESSAAAAAALSSLLDQFMATFSSRYLVEQLLHWIVDYGWQCRQWRNEDIIFVAHLKNILRTKAKMFTQKQTGILLKMKSSTLCVNCQFPHWLGPISILNFLVFFLDSSLATWPYSIKSVGRLRMALIKFKSTRLNYEHRLCTHWLRVSGFRDYYAPGAARQPASSPKARPNRNLQREEDLFPIL